MFLGERYIKYYRKLFNLALPIIKLDVPLLFHAFFNCTVCALFSIFSPKLNCVKDRRILSDHVFKTTFEDGCVSFDENRVALRTLLTVAN